jgi:hypothetical protein
MLRLKVKRQDIEQFFYCAKYGLDPELDPELEPKHFRSLNLTGTEINHGTVWFHNTGYISYLYTYASEFPRFYQL